MSPTDHIDWKSIAQRSRTRPPVVETPRLMHKRQDGCENPRRSQAARQSVAAADRCLQQAKSSRWMLTTFGSAADLLRAAFRPYPSQDSNTKVPAVQSDLNTQTA